MAIRASYVYSGMVDYWSGNGRRWDDDAGCLFAPYGRDTTLADIIDVLVDDFNTGGDCDSFPEEVTDADVREAIMTVMLNDKGRADVASGALAACAIAYADANGPPTCCYCGAEFGCDHRDSCPWGEGVVEEEDCDDWSESPVFIALIELDGDGLCINCAKENE